MTPPLEIPREIVLAFVAERLTSDEAIERGARAYAEYEGQIDWGEADPDDRDWYRAGTRLIAAALVPSRGELSPITLHLLSLLDEYGPMLATRLTNIANAECVHEDFDGLPEIQSSAGRLMGMRAGGLVRSARPYDGGPMRWEVTEAGRAAWHSYRDGSVPERPPLSLPQINWLIRAALHATQPHHPPPPSLGPDETDELYAALRALRTELTKEDDRAGA